jgi:hypothetical protein
MLNYSSELEKLSEGSGSRSRSSHLHDVFRQYKYMTAYTNSHNAKMGKNRTKTGETGKNTMRNLS